jgi:hypothetical protein
MLEQPAGRMVTQTEQPMPQDCERLIQKLRWIGFEMEARQLELALGTTSSKSACDVPLLLSR